MRHELAGRLAILTFSCTLALGASAPSAAEDSLERELDSLVEGMIRARELKGAVLRIARDDSVIYDRAFGAYSADTVINAASATKWVTAATIMTLVESGELALSTRIGEYFEDLESPVAGITIIQLLSHTSGIPGLQTSTKSLELPADISMTNAAIEILRDGIVHDPGKVFDYGGASFQVAGAIAASASGESWHALFASRMGQPIGMANSFYGHPIPQLQGRRNLKNPGMGGGLHTSMNDYWKFLSMVFHHGRAGDVQVLGAPVIQAMETNRLKDVSIGFSPRLDEQEDFRYGIGIWCEEVEPDGACSIISCPGAWGMYPWIDRMRGVMGLLLVVDQIAEITPWIERLKIALNTELDLRRQID